MIEKMKTKINDSKERGILHDTRGDVKILGEVCNELIEKVNELTEKVNELENTEK